MISNLYRTLVLLISLLLILLLVTFLLLRACVGETPTTEVERVTSPDGEVDAILTASPPAAPLMSFIGQLRVAPAGEPPEEGETVLYAEHLGKKGLDLRWRSDRLLEVRYGEKARISNFTNEEFLTDEEGELLTVRIRLVPPDEGS